MKDLYNTERAILGELIYEGDAHTRLTIKPEWFADSKHREVFAAFAYEDVATPSLLADKFGDKYIADMVSVQFGKTALKREIVTLQDAYNRRQAIQALAAGIDLIKSGQDISEASDLLAKAVSDPSGTERTRSIGDLMKDRFFHMEAVVKGEIEQNTYLKTGYRDFDDRIGGYSIGYW